MGTSVMVLGEQERAYLVRVEVRVKDDHGVCALLSNNLGSRQDAESEITHIQIYAHALMRVSASERVERNALTPARVERR